MRRADDSLIGRVAEERARLLSLQSDLMAAGDKELAAAVKRSFRELSHGSVTGIENSAPMKRREG